eukprot:613232-Prymnesium_polylepis.1
MRGEGGLLKLWLWQCPRPPGEHAQHRCTAHKHCTRTCTHIGGANGIRSDVLSGAKLLLLLLLRVRV